MFVDGYDPKSKTVFQFHGCFFYDFESYQDKMQCKQPMPDLVYENVHMPILVSLGDTLEKTPTHICGHDPKSLVRRFMAELERRGTNIQACVRIEFIP